MAKTAGGGQTIVVAGGASGGSGSGGGSKPEGGSGITSNPKSPLNSKLKIDNNLFYSIIGGAVGIFALVYMYQQNPSLFHGFIDPLRNLISGQPTVPAAPNGTVQNDQIPQSADEVAPSPTQGQWGGEMQYPQYPQQATGQQPFQYPQQPQQSQQPYQGYDPSQQYAGGGDMNTSFNPAFGQNSNVQSFSSRTRKRRYEFDSSDGMIVSR